MIFSVGDHCSTGPIGVRDQSVSRMILSISPPGRRVVPGGVSASNSSESALTGAAQAPVAVPRSTLGREPNPS